MKFGIGTASFIKNYGLLKIKGNKKDLRSIITKYSNKIDLVDTAPSYGFAERDIGKSINPNLKIVTKISKIKSKKTNSIIKEIEKKILKSLKTMNKDKIYCIMFHNENDIIKLNDKKIIEYLNNLKKKGTVKKIGISCYDTNRIPQYLKIIKFDVIQFPLNILSMTKKKIILLRVLKKNYKLELHVRSIFLQGVILNNSKKLQKKFLFLKEKQDQIKKFCLKKKISINSFLISAIYSLQFIDYAIIGLKNLSEYNELKNTKLILFKQSFLEKFLVKNQSDIDPRNWY
tara:strand:- start:420 stop:1280 length:861 start_codon:yes stop_codon:yes gene_type:complete